MELHTPHMPLKPFSTVGPARPDDIRLVLRGLLSLDSASSDLSNGLNASSCRTLYT